MKIEFLVSVVLANVLYKHTSLQSYNCEDCFLKAFLVYLNKRIMFEKTLSWLCNKYYTNNCVLYTTENITEYI